MNRIRIRDLFEPGSGMEKIWIRVKHPGSATLEYLNSVKRIRNRDLFVSGIEKIRIRVKRPGSATQKRCFVDRRVAQCAVEDCKEIIGQNNKFWRMSCLNHFLETHVDKLINSMRYKVSWQLAQYKGL